MLTSLEPKSSSFYDLLQMSPDLNLRDNRGKRHNLSLILLGVVIALLRNRDGVLSSIHRSIKNTHEQLCLALEVDQERVISRSQLPVVLSKVNVCVFEELLFSHYGLELSPSERNWFAGDGKELRGSIEKGSKRGEAIVQVVCHSTRQTVAQDFYNGKKQSEKPILRQVLTQQGLLGQKMSLDALHMNPATLGELVKSGGIFLVGVKKNQKELEADMAHYTTRTKPLEKHETIEKGHGRLEKRRYEAFCVKHEYFEDRWEPCQFSTLIKVHRERTMNKTQKKTTETSLYISNAPHGMARELFEAVRGHWSVETNNHIRDVTLSEDKFRTKKTKSHRAWPPLEHSLSPFYKN